MNQPSKAMMKQVIYFLLQTSVPRIIENENKNILLSSVNSNPLKGDEQKRLVR